MENQSFVDSVLREIVHPGVEQLMSGRFFSELREGKLSSRRLQGFALQHYLSTGFRGLVSYVESNNFDSLKSVFRMGYAQFGSVYVVKLFGRYLTHSSRGCERLGFRVEPAP